MKSLWILLCFVGAIGIGVASSPSAANAQGSKFCVDCAYPANFCVIVSGGAGYFKCTNMNPGCDFDYTLGYCMPDITMSTERIDIAPDGSMRGVANRVALAVKSASTVPRRPGSTQLNVRTMAFHGGEVTRTCGNVIIERSYATVTAQKLRAESSTLVI